MFKFNTTHIFTGYLKQLLSSVNIPTCRIYTKEFANYLKQHGKEDPRVIESFDMVTYTSANANAAKQRIATSVNYLKANELYNYVWDYSQTGLDLGNKNVYWKRTSPIFYSGDKSINGLTRVLSSQGNVYDTATHEYLGEYLRFVRDYYGINLMSLYNCFNNTLCKNIYYKHEFKTIDKTAKDLDKEYLDYESSLSVLDKTSVISIKNVKNIGSQDRLHYKNAYSIFDSLDSRYRIYAFPVKLFSNYTVAVDCSQGIEMFCGLYTTTLETTSKGIDLITKTYRKINRTIFSQPFLYDAPSVKYWNFAEDTSISANGYPILVNDDSVTRWDIANREQDLKLFIKVPSSCRSSITILEGNFSTFYH